MMKLAVLLSSLCWLLGTCGAEAVGHLKPLGSHKPPTLVTEELRVVPQPKQFYDDYVKPRRPVVFRGASTHSGAYRRWSVENIIENYGDLVVRLEARHEESSEIPVTDIGAGRSTIRYFASNYRSLNAYVISQVPGPMEKDVAIPPCLRCGTFAESIQEVHLFIVGKGGKTLLHRDPYSNIHCVFNGTKDWILIGDDQGPHLYQSHSSIDEFGGFSDIDVDEVDLNTFPRVANIEYSKVTLDRGDCMFVPGGFWHQVRVHGEYNTAVSIWFSRDFKYLKQDWSNCGEEYEFSPMNEVDILWRFSGGNTTLSQGHMDINTLRAVLVSFADDQGRISIAQFVRELIDQNDDNHVIDQIKQVLDVTGDVITTKVVSGWSKDLLRRILLVVDPPDPSNSIDIELSTIDVQDMRVLLQDMKNDEEAVTKSKFADEYRKLRGSYVMSNEFFNQLDTNSDDVITNNELAFGFDDVINRCVSAPHHDPTTERRWMAYLRSRDEL